MKTSHYIVILALLFAIVAIARCETKEYTVTAYCACEKCCGKWAKHKKTASGHTPKEGVTIAASRAIPFGTKMFIEGVGERIVQDRLATKYDSRIDVYFESHQKALEFGKRKLKVTQR